MSAMSESSQKNSSERFPQTAVLFGAYFHQDFDFEYGSPSGTIAAFLEDAGPEDAKSTLAEIVRMLGELNDHELSCTLVKFGNAFAYETLGLDARQWLQRVAEQIELSLSV